jgi:hypothetical protein
MCPSSLNDLISIDEKNLPWCSLDKSPEYVPLILKPFPKHGVTSTSNPHSIKLIIMQQLTVNVAARFLYTYCKLTTLQGGGGAGARFSISSSSNAAAAILHHQ